jgi:hypothetical protein
MNGFYRVGETEGGGRVVRGGSWNNDNTENFRCANRNYNRPDNRNDNNGFRCASTLRFRARRTTDAGVHTRESRSLPGCVRKGVAEYRRGFGRLVAAEANAARIREPRRAECHEMAH